MVFQISRYQLRKIHLPNSCHKKFYVHLCSDKKNDNTVGWQSMYIKNVIILYYLTVVESWAAGPIGIIQQSQRKPKWSNICQYGDGLGMRENEVLPPLFIPYMS